MADYTSWQNISTLITPIGAPFAVPDPDNQYIFPIRGLDLPIHGSISDPQIGDNNGKFRFRVFNISETVLYDTFFVDSKIHSIASGGGYVVSSYTLLSNLRYHLVIDGTWTRFSSGESNPYGITIKYPSSGQPASEGASYDPYWAVSNGAAGQANSNCWVRNFSTDPPIQDVIPALRINSRDDSLSTPRVLAPAQRRSKSVQDSIRIRHGGNTYI